MTRGEIVFETKNFFAEAAPHPFVSREEGGHIRVLPKVTVEDRTKLSVELATELMIFTMIIGEALVKGMSKRGVEIGRVNYQDMGNWGPTLHIHIFGRAVTAVKQRYGEAVYLPKKETGFYEGFKPLNSDDVEEIKKNIDKLIKSKKYDGILNL